METPPLKACLEHADQLAQDVIDAWNGSTSGDFSPEFQTLLNTAFRYLTAKENVEVHRAFSILTEQDEYEGETARIIFCTALQDFVEGGQQFPL